MVIGPASPKTYYLRNIPAERRSC